MKKKQTSWIPAGLLTIVTTIATIYSLLEYRNSVLIVGVASLLLLLSAFWLFTCISRLQKQGKESSVGQIQRERMNYEGMKLQGEELIRLVNTLGKGTYVYSKRSSEHLQELLDCSLQIQQNNEQLLNDLIQNQTKVAKYQVKYEQEHTTKLINSLSDNCKHLNGTLEQCIAAIQNHAPQPKQTDTGIIDKLVDLSKELSEINNNIQALQLQLTTISTQAISATPVSEPPIIAEAQEPVMPEPDMTAETQEAVMSEPDMTAETQEAVMPEPDMTAELLEALISESDITVEAQEPVMPEPAPIPEEPKQDPLAAMISDDPNKQLSADEIAALFSALG